MTRLHFRFCVRLLGSAGLWLILTGLPLKAQQVPVDQAQPKVQEQPVQSQDHGQDYRSSGSKADQEKTDPKAQDDAQTQVLPNDQTFPENLEDKMQKEEQPSSPDQKPGPDQQPGTEQKSAVPDQKEPDNSDAQKDAKGKDPSSAENKDLRAPSYQAVWDKYPVLSCKFFGTYFCQDGKCNFEKRTKPSMFRIDFAKNMLREHTELDKATINKASPIVNRIWQKPRDADKTKSKFKKALVKELHDGTFIILDGGEFHLWTLYEEPQKKLYRAFYNSHTLGLSVTGAGVCLPSR